MCEGDDFLRFLPHLCPKIAKNLIYGAKNTVFGIARRFLLCYNIKVIYKINRRRKKKGRVVIMQYGLLGKTLGHSYSPEIHGLFGCPDYCLREVPPDELDTFMKSADFKGINVTVPYKKAVLPYIHSLSDEARMAGSVNCIVKKEDGTLYGDNTDTKGFDALLTFSKINVRRKKVLVLGSGGAAGAVHAVLRRRGVREAVTVSRTGEVNYSNVHLLHGDADVIVNATPVGMYPNNGESPIDIAPFSRLSGVIDIIYNPDKTALVLAAEKRGITALGGLYMLVAQAAAADELFFGKKISDAEVRRVYTRLRASKRNLVLIGMPGSGKSVIGKRLASALHRPFVDVDRVIEGGTGRSIPDIFAEDGEDAFRALETEYTQNVCRESGQIIACGGGVVTREANRDAVRENSAVVYLIRNTAELATRGRPVSQANSLEALAAVRIPIYKAWSDVKILNCGINPTVGQIIRFMHLRPESKGDTAKEDAVNEASDN